MDKEKPKSEFLRHMNYLISVLFWSYKVPKCSEVVENGVLAETKINN